MAEPTPLKFLATTGTPTTWKPNYFYAIYLSGNDVECYITSQSGVPKRMGNTQMIIDIINSQGIDWGNIGGDIADQTDLIAVLTQKEEKSNKAEDVTTVDHTLYPSVQTMVEYVNSLIPDGLLSGGIVSWSGVGYVYDVTEAIIKLGGIVYIIPSGQVTLDPSHPTLDRTDVVYVDINSFGVLTGTPATEPITPQVEIGTQIYLTSISVSANTTEPGGEVVTEFIYRENVEWTGSFSGAGTVDFADTSNPNEGTYAVETTAVEKDNPIIFDRGTDFEILDWDVVSFKIDLKQALEKDVYIVVGYLDALDNPVSNQVQIPVNRDLVGSYQFVAVQKELFTPTAPAQKIYIKHTRPSIGAYPIGYYLDEFKLQSGVGQGTNLQHNSLSGLNEGEYQHLTVAEKAQALNPEASNVEVTPAGNLSSTDVQLALEELQGDIDGIDTGVQSVTGDGVDNTDPENPILSFPTPAEIGALEAIFFDYLTTTAMIADQAGQDTQTIYVVADASDDPNITFPSGTTDFHAYYQYLGVSIGVSNGLISDYDLMGAPYSDVKGGELETLKGTLVIQDKVILNSRPGNWDEIFGEHGNQITVGNKIIICYTGRLEDGSGTYTGIATSDDNGETWSRSETFDAVANRKTEDPYIIYFNNTYFLYVEDKQDVPFRNIRGYSSVDLITWTDLGDVLDIEVTGFDSQDVSSPTLYVEDGVIYMFYEGRGTLDGITNSGAMGVATSTDGENFTKVGLDPIFVGSPFTSENKSQWVDRVVPDDIIKIGDYYYMSYHGYNGFNNVMGIARSGNLLTGWQDFSDGPKKFYFNNEVAGLGTLFYKINNDLKLFHINEDLTSIVVSSTTSSSFKEENTINSIVEGEPTGSDQVVNVVSLTQAEYTAGTKVATTFYIITDA